MRIQQNSLALRTQKTKVEAVRQTRPCKCICDENIMVLVAY